jgi:transcriptional regulator with GAF, ATPase, and Fis domain
MKETHELVRKVATELLAVKRRSHLAAIIKSTLKAEIQYDQAAIFILDSDNNQLYDLLQTVDPSAEHHTFSPLIQLKELSIEEILLDNNSEHQGFSEFNLADDEQRSVVSKYLRNKPLQGARIMVFSLRGGNDFTGNFLLLFNKSTPILPDVVDALKVLAVTINMAVNYVLAEERVLAVRSKNRFTELGRLSSSLLDVRDYEDLKRIVQEILLPYFNAVSFVVILKSDNGTYRVLLVVHTTDLCTIAISNDTYSGAYSIYDHCHGKSIEGLTFYNLETLERLAHEVPHLQAELGHGIIEKVIYPLNYEGRDRGFILINYARNNAIEEVASPMAKLILSQFTKALFHLLKQEQVRVQLAHQDRVIKLGALLASVRSNEELLDVINTSLKTIIGYTNTIITAINSDKSTASAYILDYQAVGHYENGHSLVVSSSYPINDGFLDKVLVQNNPLIFDLENLIRDCPLPSYLKANYDSGVKQVVMTKLAKGSEAFGFWVLAFDRYPVIAASTIQLIREVANQLSISLQTIQFNLIAERREKEKNRLMQFSSSIASIRDKDKLTQAIKGHLKELFGIDDFLIWSLSKDFQFRSPILFDKASVYTHHPRFQAYAEKQINNADGIYDVLIEEGGIHYFGASDLKLAYADHTDFSEDVETNTSMAAGGIVLRVGDEVIGILTFLTRDVQLVQEKEELFLTICSQLAVMASNLITTDLISEQLAEIKHYNERLEDEKIHLLKELELPANNSDMIGHSAGNQAVLKLIQQVAYTDSTVLILGETGTGKELVARSIHNNSPRKSKLMVKVNCAALPATLVESELFGHEKGSFTGASERRIGKFELANNGTLFLDEIGEMPLDLQGKLLRALQEKEIERIGGKTVVKVDVRVIVATNRNLEQEVAAGRFRSDLFYRVNIFPIRLPPLRNRLSDIPLLASHFIAKYASKVGKEIKSLSSHVLEDLQRYHWPGNIRELEHIIERSVLLTKGDTIKSMDIPKSTSIATDGSMYLDKKIKTLDENERDHILRILNVCRGRINGQHGAATLLGIPPSTLNSKMKRLAIRKQEIQS